MWISRPAMATLVVGVLGVGLALGRVTTAFQPDPGARPTALPSLATHPPLPPTLPVVDVDGEDFLSLPRYPGAVRTRYETRDDAVSSTTVEYLAVSTVEAARIFYRQVFAEHGWTVVDLQLAYGEIRYLLASGDLDGVVDIESRGGGVVEIDLEILAYSPSATDPPEETPTATPRPSRTGTPTATPRPPRPTETATASPRPRPTPEAPTATPRPRPTPTPATPTATPRPTPTDDDDDGGGGGGDDDRGGGGDD